MNCHKLQLSEVSTSIGLLKLKVLHLFLNLDCASLEYYLWNGNWWCSRSRCVCGLLVSEHKAEELHGAFESWLSIAVLEQWGLQKYLLQLSKILSKETVFLHLNLYSFTW